ncbi:hypothetical protein AN478_11000 [Thiohalorhabdus denitrificans]|uniref:Uncharacterized protein n=1 Tax=Thiohalorhabdus denitrificans TaxID=381306 RepID=A0A0N8PMT8_9GAMM|nr:hypothetical protein [Thiohalorhabdus denitrificans]KPV39645.1 hypothetical protein AN478_11000 [Thiohalorhabdus denitrificans]SCX95706.1 hypothetical protein SAMN05661077_0833 [Thiohalorhabdus denitrificans]
MAGWRHHHLTRQLMTLWAVFWMALAAPCVIAGTPDHHPWANTQQESPSGHQQASGPIPHGEPDALVCLHDCNQVAIKGSSDLFSPASPEALFAAWQAPAEVFQTGFSGQRARPSPHRKPDHPRPATFLLIRSFLI